MQVSAFTSQAAWYSLFHRTAGGKRRGAPLDCGEIDLDRLEGFRTQDGAGIALRVPQRVRMSQPLLLSYAWLVLGLTCWWRNINVTLKHYVSIVS